MEETPLIDNRTSEIVAADDAWERRRRIISLKRNVEQTYLELAEELAKAYVNKDWRQLESCGSWNAYLGDPEVNISRWKAEMLIAVYERYIIAFKCLPEALLPSGYNKLHLLLPYVTKDNVGTLVAQAEATSRSDLVKWIKEAFPPKSPPPLPDGKYRIIYADPPWAYDNSGFDQSAASIYPTMSVVEICALPIGDRAADECVLFLWATSPLLPEALHVMEAWGFEYKASRVWVKNRAPGMGWFVNTRHELLLIGVRGQGHPSDKLDSVIEAPVTRHSAKPESVYLDIEFCYEGPYIELFARNQREGWASWGNEL